MDSQSRPLLLYNSLTKKKEPFTPVGGGNRVTWYNCGPTVYDHSHMGHARSYMTFDIIRRILQDYFGYDVFFVQNVTDIDDKIIKRARQRYLFQEYQNEVQQGAVNKEILAKDIQEGIKLLKEAIQKEESADKKSMLEKTLTKITQSLEKDGLSSGELVSQCKEALVLLLDDRKAPSINDNSIFALLPKEFEEEYNRDMESLNVLRPSAVTRVSEYVPEIVDYIRKIIDNGYAYESNGSVYFDVDKFNSTPKHRYAKLDEKRVGDSVALAEGEGELSATSTTEKRNTKDFALWKKSKAGEPFWESPWGSGRPGWHIECSVMASALLGEAIDIHSGGIDLRFPHHDNEIAQAEAFYDTGKDWIKVFLHSGHLHIDGLKMSKSLKNFITIREALTQYTKRQIRLVFLLHPWLDTLNYSKDTMKDAISLEKYIFEFFLTSKDIIRSVSSKEGRKWTDREVSLHKKLTECQDGVDRSLRDNLDTKSALDSLKELIGSSYVYLKGGSPNEQLIEDVARYIRQILKVFGVVDEATIECNFDSTGTGSGATNSEEIVMPFLRVLADFRQEIKGIGISSKNKEILSACDRLRDETLPELGVRLEDSDSKTVVKLVDKETILREKEADRLRKEEKEREKEQRKREQEEKEARSRIPPVEWAKMTFIESLEYKGKFSKFDERNIPTHDLEGKELSKGQRKKFEKMFDEQDRRYRKAVPVLNSQTANAAN